MRRINKVLIVFTVAFAVGSAVSMQKRARQSAPFVFRRANWESYEYQLRPIGSAQHFDLRFGFKALARPMAFRAVVNCQDPENYYYVEVNEGDVRLGKVEEEFDLRIGSQNRLDAADGRKHEMVIKRRDGALTVVVDGQIAAEAFDDAFSGGSIGLGRLNRSARFSGVRLQPVGDVFFTDDFMRAETDPGLWEPGVGKWRIASLDNPSLSSNAFLYVGRATSDGPAQSIAGSWFWDNYRAEVACQPGSAACFGLYFCYQDPDNHFLWKWGGDSDAAKMQVLRVADGRATPLAERDGGFQVGQWYRLRCHVQDGYVELFVDDRPMLSAADPALCFGKIGLYTEDTTRGTHFDDVGVTSRQSFRDDFEHFSVGKWAEMGGKWGHVVDRSSTGEVVRRMTASSTGPAKAVTGLDKWRNYTFTVDVGHRRKGVAGICAYYLDENNYYAVRLRRGDKDEVRELVRVADGVEKVIAQDVTGLAAGETDTVALRAMDGHLSVAIGGKPCFEGFDNALPGGKVGLLLSHCALAWFDNARLTFHSAPKPLLSVHEVFAHEKSMQIWSGAESDWEQHYENADGRGYGVHWHRAAFHGDVSIQLAANELVGDRNTAGLIIGAHDLSFDSGFRLSADRRDGQWSVRLTEGAATVAEETLAASAPLRQLRLRRAGAFVAGYVNGRCRMWHRSKSGGGAKIAYYARGVNVDREDVLIRAGQVYNDLFRQAPADWRLAAGTWEVTNRWECDPRWSFFSGRSYKLAAIWNKHVFDGDVVVEFYAGPKMDSSRGRRYEYASDMNVALCADGQDLTSGYNFMFGGWRNTATALVRRGTVVAQTRSHTIPTKDIHRRWFYIRAVKRGPALTLYIDNRQVLSYSDTDPLQGGQVAIWTYRNGLMVSRVRMSYEGSTVKEAPRPGRPAEPRCVYDVVPSLGW